LTGFRERLVGRRWVHSHEEDSDEAQVFRPADHPFPPSRGRTSFELRPDGTYVESSPGPVDAPEASTGTWSLDGGRLILGAEGDRPGHAWEVTSVEEDRLTLKRD
jgi:hypothetical protein